MEKQLFFWVRFAPACPAATEDIPQVEMETGQQHSRTMGNDLSSLFLNPILCADASAASWEHRGELSLFPERPGGAGHGHIPSSRPAELVGLLRKLLPTKRRENTTNLYYCQCFPPGRVHRGAEPRPEPKWGDGPQD